MTTGGGFNGGGGCTILSGYTNDSRYGSGGGATHIAVGTDRGVLSNYSSTSYRNQVLIVAGGGGGGGVFFSSYAADYRGGAGGHGGGYIGGTSTNNSTTTEYPTWKTITSSGGTQSAGGTSGSGASGAFGTAGSVLGTTAMTGGGGGWFGGASGRMVGSGGGSGYIGNTLLSSKGMYCYNCSTSTAEATYTVSTTNVSSTAKSNYAKSGNGYAKITFIDYRTNSLVTLPSTALPSGDRYEQNGLCYYIKNYGLSNTPFSYNGYNNCRFTSYDCNMSSCSNMGWNGSYGWGNFSWNDGGQYWNIWDPVSPACEGTVVCDG